MMLFQLWERHFVIFIKTNRIIKEERGEGEEKEELNERVKGNLARGLLHRMETHWDIQEAKMQLNPCLQRCLASHTETQLPRGSQHRTYSDACGFSCSWNSNFKLGWKMTISLLLNSYRNTQYAQRPVIAQTEWLKHTSLLLCSSAGSKFKKTWVPAWSSSGGSSFPALWLAVFSSNRSVLTLGRERERSPF